MKGKQLVMAGLIALLTTGWFSSRSRFVFENAIQSCLQVASLSPENAAKARILRARARLNSGAIFGAQEGMFYFAFLTTEF